MKKINLVLTCIINLIFICLFLVSCDGQKDISQSDQLTGTWIEIAPYSDGIRDTLRFTQDKLFELYTPLQGYKFDLTQQNRLSIYSTSIKYDFSISLSENGGKEQLEIYNFMDRSLTANVKNISFIKLK
jgi:hypothetical protein